MKNFLLEQPFALKVIENSVKNNTISHAYLVNSNGYPYAFDFVVEMVKSFLCSNHLDEKDCNDCNLCRKIDDGNYPELRIIDSDGMWIKKNQILDLQVEFSKIAVEGNKRVYVIREADRMNQQTANSILKFLEEPNNDIIAILITDNVNQILNTIVSRCQIINLKNTFNYGINSLENFAYLCSSSKNEYDSFVSDDNNLKFLNSLFDFLNYFESNNLNSIVFAKEIWHSKFKDKDEVLKVIDLMINFYYDVLLYRINNKINFFVDKENFIKEIALINDRDNIIRKISVCIECRDKLKFNLNMNLFYDKFIIMLGGR